MRAGQMRDRVTFQEAQEVSDGGGGYDVTWSPVATVWGSFIPERGSERVQAGRIENPVSGVLRIRYSSDVSGIDETYRALIDGVVYNIRSVTQPDRRQRAIEMIIERGVAT